MVRSSRKYAFLTHEVHCLLNSAIFKPVTDIKYHRTLLGSFFCPVIFTSVELGAHIAWTEKITVKFLLTFTPILIASTFFHTYLVSYFMFRGLYSKRITTLTDVNYTLAYGLTYMPVLLIINRAGIQLTGIFIFVYSILVSIYYYLSMKKDIKVGFGDFSFLILMFMFIYNIVLAYFFTFGSVEILMYILAKL